MAGQAVNAEVVEAVAHIDQSVALTTAIAEAEALATSIPAKKSLIRTSLKASTLDGVFATVFSNAAGGVLLSNFLVELHASPTQIGMLASIPMLANLIQPIGAFLGDRTNSRHWYCFWIYTPARLLWLFLPAGIALADRLGLSAEVLITLALAIVFVSHFAGALGSASWLSWLATLVPRRLRGRYFGIRNSAASLTNLLSAPLLGWLISSWYGGSIQGYGFVVFLGVIAGLISLGFQFWMLDVNPQRQHEENADEEAKGEQAGAQDARREDEDNQAIDRVSLTSPLSPFALLKDSNFLLFLVYFGLWMFAVNLSAPFFNVYLLDNLNINLQSVTLYNSLQAGANLIMLVIWGKLADRIGNRSLLLSIGVLVAITPLLWVATGANFVSIWVWFPLLHILAGSTWAAIDLCINNLQLGVAPVQQQATYFAIAAAVSGVCGALGTTVGSLLVEYANYGGILGVFALSAIVRLGALLPLVFVHEQRGQSLRQLMQTLFPSQADAALVEEE